MKSEFKTVLAHLDTKCKHKPLESNMELHGTMYIYINKHVEATQRYSRIMNMIYILSAWSKPAFCHTGHPKLKLLSNLCLPLFNNDCVCFAFFGHR